MPDRICAIYCDPPIAFARLGGSTTPLAAYRWERPQNPRTDSDTVVVPTWSLNVLPDATVDPFLPQTVRFRDGSLLRPVCPFVEVWALVGEAAAAPSTWRAAPLTPDLLAAEDRSVADLSFTVTARNLKAQRRTRMAGLAYGNFPDLVIGGDDHAVHPILGSSPPGTANPMIPVGRNIPLGSLQVMKSRPQPAAGTTDWASEINVETVRIRFTPAAGHVYGPPQAAAPDVENGPAVPSEQAFLNAAAGWFGSDRTAHRFVVPADTFDTRNRQTQASLGVVDDTCEARVVVRLARGGQPALTAHANLFSAPPDYAPDRRPFLSIADELNDRSADAATRNAALSEDQLEAWVADLFERIYETVSLLNVDFWRDQNATPDLPAARLAPPIPDDGMEEPRRPLGGEDALRNRDLQIGRASDQTPLPLSDHARARHRQVSDIDTLRSLVRADPQRLRTLVRAAFESEQLSPTVREGLRQSTMRMPPFMAQSTPSAPLSLAAWQYDLLMAWVAAQVAPPPAPPPAPAPFALEVAAVSSRADRRRAAILRRLDEAQVDR